MIKDEVEDFIRKTGISAAILARDSGVSADIICKLIAGVIRDTSSSRADALRASMRKLSALQKATKREEQNADN